MSKKRQMKTKVCRYCGKTFNTRTDKECCSRQCSAIVSANRRGQKDTLCWDCKKANADSNCSWANDFIPVEGWKAKPTIIKVTTQTKERAEQLSHSFIVIKCPLFERD